MDTDLGSRIKYFRDLRGFSQEELAHYCGVSTPAVSNWETGKSRPTGVNIEKLVSALKIDESALFAPSENIVPKNEILRELLDIVAEFDFKGQMLFLSFAKWLKYTLFSDVLQILVYLVFAFDYLVLGDLK